MRNLLMVVLAILMVSFVRDHGKKSHYIPTKLCVNKVINNIKTGPLTGNQNLAFGVKQVLTEAAEDKGWSIVADEFDADQVIDVEITYFDFNQVKNNISVFHKDDNMVIIKMKGTVSQDGKTIKSAEVEDKSDEITSATGVISTDGKFNSVTVRNAVKKTCVKLSYKLL